MDDINKNSDAQHLWLTIGGNDAGLVFANVRFIFGGVNSKICIDSETVALCSGLPAAMYKEEGIIGLSDYIMDGHF